MNELTVLTNIYDLIVNNGSWGGDLSGILSDLKELINDEDDSDIDSLVEYQQQIVVQQNEINHQVKQLNIVCVSLALITFTLSTFAFFRNLVNKWQKGV